jgi:hypothetical protein
VLSAAGAACTAGPGARALPAAQPRRLLPPPACPPSLPPGLPRAHLANLPLVYSVCRIWLFQCSLLVMQRKPPVRRYRMRPLFSQAP